LKNDITIINSDSGNGLRATPALNWSLMNAEELLTRLTSNPAILSGKPTIRGRRLAVEHVLGMLAAGDSVDDVLAAYDWLEREDILACLAFASRVVGNERVELREAAP